MPRALGIDLGTTYSVAATMEDGRVKILPNAEGHELTPSVVAFGLNGGVLVGKAAKSRAARDPRRTVFSIKRRMGSGSKVQIGEQEYTPQQISGLILGKVRADVERALGEPIDQAVITVPAYFNDRQRQATRDAAALAGLEVTRIINEPTAAALAYGLTREDVHTVLVWDLGGGTFDVSILDLGEGIFEVRAVSGDGWLGGDDFDQRIVEYLVDEYRRRTAIDFPEEPSARQRLREAAEAAKRQLSSSLAASIYVPVLQPPRFQPLDTQLTRQQFEDLTAELVQRMVVPTEQALADAKLTPESIDRVILVGGATRMPAVRDLARKMLGKEPYRYVEPDKTVAVGAAIQSAMLLGLVDRVVLLDVLPLSLGVETQGGLMATIIARNTPVPASGDRIFTTAADNQTSMDIHVLQGERVLAADNVSLGQFEVSDVPSGPRGACKVLVSFEADVDGIVHVSVAEPVTEAEVTVKVASTKFLDRSEIDHLAEEAQLHAEEDQQERERITRAIEEEQKAAAAGP